MNDEAGVGYLLGRARLVENRIRTLVAHRRMHDPAPDDPFRGLYLSEAVVDSLLGDAPDPPAPDVDTRRDVERSADAAEERGDTIRLRRLARAASLSPADVELLVVCLLPDLDPRFERLYGYLNDDVSRRRATVALALELADLSPLAAEARARLAAGSPLVEHRLVLIEETDRPFLTRGLRVPDRVTAHLLGDDLTDPVLRDVLADPVGFDTPWSTPAAVAIDRGQSLTYLREVSGGVGVATAVAAFARLGRPALCADATPLVELPDLAEVAGVLCREALLTGSGLVVGGVGAQPGSAPRTAELIRVLARASVPVVLVGVGPWDPQWTVTPPLLVETGHLAVDDRVQLWRNLLRASGESVDPGEVAERFVLNPDQVHHAIGSAAATARSGDGAVDLDALRRGARAQNATGLERLARRVEPDVGWPDLVLPPGPLTLLHELTARARHRDRVLREWRMRPGGARGIGVTGLFAGESGTGKTMAAEVVAHDLGLDLYTVNLSSVVDKYVGETEKNLERIFSEAAGVNAVLLFDEADAIFGKRSEVRDAHDRYANIESAYLLQRMETFDGIAILTTNLRANLDEAFTRRIDVVVDFPEPDEAARLALWRVCLAPPLPRENDLDLDYCARSFPLSGGNIRSAAVTAGYRAAEGGRPVSMVDLVSAIRQEYRKLGRLVLGRDFAPHLEATGSPLGE